jgi:two-component system, cell cycle sensor histidine kinase and response regulator CckA
LVPKTFRLKETKKKLRQLKKSLQQSEERFFKLFNFCSMPLLLTTCQDGYVLDANAAFTHIFGYSRHEIIGLTTAECGLCINPERRRTFALKVQKEVIRNFEEQLRSKSGEIRKFNLSADTLRVRDEECILSRLTCTI